MTDLAPLCQYLEAAIKSITEGKRSSNAMPPLALKLELKTLLHADMEKALETLVEEGRIISRPTLNSTAYEPIKQTSQ